MDDRHKSVRNRVDNEILFSKTVKAGKRIYYIDVKRDRKGEFYLSLTESKRVKEQSDVQYSTFEKHKIFLYREDLNKFMSAFNEAAGFAQSKASQVDEALEWSDTAVAHDGNEGGCEANDREYRIEIDF